MVLRRELPPEFYAEVKMRFPHESDMQNGGFAGIKINYINFVIRNDGTAWMPYLIPGETKYRGSAFKLKDFTYNKYYVLKVVGKQLNDTTKQFVFSVNGNQIGAATVPLNEKAKLELSLFASRGNAYFDDFQLSNLNKSENSSPNVVVNSSFEYTQEGIPTYFDTSYRYFKLGKDFEQYLRNLSIDSTEKYAEKQSLKIVHDNNEIISGIRTYDTAVVVDQPYVFSIYLKADQENFPAKLTIWEMRDRNREKNITLSTKWQRFEFQVKAAERGNIRAGFAFSRPGTVWADALQVEFAANATEYKVSDLDRVKFNNKKEELKEVVFTAAMLDRPPEMGNLDAFAKSAGVISEENFYFRAANAKAQTRAFAACDSRNLYIGVRCFVPDPEKIKIYDFPYDDLRNFGPEHLELFLDPGKLGKYFQFTVGTGGGKCDFGYGRNLQWNAQWDAVAKINPQSKSIDYMLKLPLSMLLSVIKDDVP
ncbi:MAG: hypothetical protein LBM70_09070, partial [Victivallales bacterium]|nr:hypothetical protein [Victivallales bacterium]